MEALALKAAGMILEQGLPCTILSVVIVVEFNIIKYLHKELTGCLSNKGKRG